MNYKHRVCRSPPSPRKGEGGERTSSARPRDYYRIEDEDGRRYWVFREGLYQESEDWVSWLVPARGLRMMVPAYFSCCASPRGAWQHHAAINSATSGNDRATSRTISTSIIALEP